MNFNKKNIDCYCNIKIEEQISDWNSNINLYQTGENSIDVYIGKDFTSNGTNIYAGSKKIIIGNDCMFSWNTSITCDDFHAIYDLETKKIINKQKEDFIIGNHCWIAQNAILLKNSGLSNNCIVAANSVITNKINENNVIIAGNPGKIIKRNINWDRKSLAEFELLIPNSSLQ